MSCMIADSRTLRLAALAFAFGQEIEGYVYSGTAIRSEELEDVARKLYALNVRAYNGRYREDIPTNLDEKLFYSHALYSLKKDNFYSREHMEWGKALKFVRYQCGEDATENDPLYADMKAAESAFLVALTTFNPEFEALPWGG